MNRFVYGCIAGLAVAAGCQIAVATFGAARRRSSPSEGRRSDAILP